MKHPGHPDNHCESVLEEWQRAMLPDLEQPRYRTLSNGMVKDCYTGLVHEPTRSLLDDPETPYDKTPIATNQPIDV